MRDLLVVGDANVDITARVKDFPQRGCGAFGSVEKTKTGGTGVNVAVAAARLGLKVSLVTALGTDQYAETVMELLTGEGIDTRYIKRVSQPTGSVFLMIDETGEKTFCAFRLDCADWQLRREDLPPPEELEQTRALFITGVNISEAKVIKPSAELSVYALEQAGAKGLLTFFDPNIRAADWELPADVLALLHQTAVYSDFFLPNADELRTIRGQGPVGGKQATVMKAGGKGCTVVTKSGETKVPAWPAKVLDTSGAGDAFNAGFIYACLQGESPVEAARWATKVAGATVAKIGTTDAFPYHHEL